MRLARELASLIAGLAMCGVVLFLVMGVPTAVVFALTRAVATVVGYVMGNP